MLLTAWGCHVLSGSSTEEVENAALGTEFAPEVVTSDLVLSGQPGADAMHAILVWCTDTAIARTDEVG